MDMEEARPSGREPGRGRTPGTAANIFRDTANSSKRNAKGIVKVPAGYQPILSIRRCLLSSSWPA